MQHPLFGDAISRVRAHFRPRKIPVRGGPVSEALALQHSYHTGVHDALDYLISLSLPPAVKPVEPVEWGTLQESK